MKEKQALLVGGANFRAESEDPLHGGTKNELLS